MEWIGRAENLVICGPSGTGKSHLAEALGHRAIDDGKTVAWHTLESLATSMRRHRADDSVNRAIARLIRSDLIVIDDIGILPVAPDAAEALFGVVDAAYEKRSIALTSNIHPAGFDELMTKTLAAPMAVPGEKPIAVDTEFPAARTRGRRPHRCPACHGAEIASTP